MALEVLKGVEEIGGFKVLAERPLANDGMINWHLFDEQRKESPIYIDRDNSMISFRLKNATDNGCDITTLIEAAKVLIEKHSDKSPCGETIYHLEQDLTRYIGTRDWERWMQPRWLKSSTQIRGK